MNGGKFLLKNLNKTKFIQKMDEENQDAVYSEHPEKPSYLQEDENVLSELINVTVSEMGSNFFHPNNSHYVNPFQVLTNESINNSDNFDLLQCQDSDGSGLFNKYFETIVCMLYIFIFIMAVVGNGMVCFIVQSSPRMRTVTNYFIANLAIGDMLMALFCIPFSFVSLFVLQYWPFGATLCRIVNYTQAVSVLVSAYTLVAISMDRYIAIMWPLRPRITKT